MVARKLKFIKDNIKKWNKEVLWDVTLGNRKYKLSDSINILDVNEEFSSLSNKELEQRRLAKEEPAKTILFDEISWRQKSRTLCLRIGDRNTSCFHRVANFQRKFNFMSSVTVDGDRFEDLIDMKLSIHGFYKALFSASKAWRPKVDGLHIYQIQLQWGLRRFF